MYSASTYYNREPNSQGGKKKNEKPFKVDPACILFMGFDWFGVFMIDVLQNLNCRSL